MFKLLNLTTNKSLDVEFVDRRDAEDAALTLDGNWIVVYNLDARVEQSFGTWTMGDVFKV